jgi:hypothetical protein
MHYIRVGFKTKNLFSFNQYLFFDRTKLILKKGPSWEIWRWPLFFVSSVPSKNYSLTKYYYFCRQIYACGKNISH